MPPALLSEELSSLLAQSRITTRFLASGSTSTAGTGNTAAGYTALLHGTNVNNTAIGYNALYDTTSGGYNTAVGANAGGSNTIGGGNTFIGYGAGSAPNTPDLVGATAIGAGATVAASSSLVLGSTRGVNGATGSVNVGIGTPAPLVTLDVNGGVIHVNTEGVTNPKTTAQGAYLGWNALTGGTGETDFINNQGLGTGGFAFMNTPQSGSPRTLLMDIAGNGTTVLNGALGVTSTHSSISCTQPCDTPIAGFNNSSAATLQLQNFVTPANSNFIESQFNGNGTATFFTDTLGDTVATGSKSAAVPLQSGELVKVFSMESPEVWFEDFGSGRLSGGSTIISLDPRFAQTVNLAIGYHVFLTPKGDCKGLFVTGETNHGFEVRELGGGQSNIEFDYRIVAHRNGYESERLPTAAMPAVGPFIAVPTAATIDKESR